MKPRYAFLGYILASLCPLSGSVEAQVITEFGAGITASALPFDITADPDGNLWFTERAIDRIGMITPAGVVTEFSALALSRLAGCLRTFREIARNALFHNLIYAGRRYDCVTSEFS
jgi:hypothetical protein